MKTLNAYAGKGGQSIQLHRFSDGGFVLHRITDPQMAGRMSAWYDAQGNVLDAEAYDKLNRAHPVKANSFAWGVAQKYGRIHKQ